MTVPINIPIITTSPPSVKSAKPFIKPEKSGDFEQILKQKTSETSQADNGILQNDHAVKVQPQNNIESEVKSTQEDTKSERLDEENKPINRANENAQSQMTCQLESPLVQTQAVPVLTLNSTPIDQTKLEVSSETKVDQMGEGGSVSTTPAESASQQNLSALSALPGETVISTSGTDKMTSKLPSEAVDEAAGKDAKDVKDSGQPLQTQEKDPSISQTKPDIRFDTITQSLSSAQEMTKAAGQEFGFCGCFFNRSRRRNNIESERYCTRQPILIRDRSMEKMYQNRDNQVWSKKKALLHQPK